jgi:hypothetical protein
VNLYIDDDSVDGLLIKLLRAAGHDVVIPHDIGRDGAKDPVHFMEAIQRSRAVLTKNSDDFELLHRLVRLVSGHHPGILVVRKDNDPKRDMSQKQIVRAIRRFESSGVAVADGFHILNFYH